MNRLKHTPLLLILFCLSLNVGLAQVNCSNGQSGTVWQENFNVDKISSGSNYSWTTDWTGEIGFNNAGDIKNSNWGFLTAQENENWNGRHTGPIVASDYLNSGGDGGKFLIYKSNGLNKPEAEIVSPAIDLSTFNGDGELSFLVYQYGGQGNLQTSGIGELKLYAKEAGTSNWNLLTLNMPAQQITNSEAWSKVTVNISSYVGKEIQIKFSYRDKEPSTPNNSGNIAIDSISIETCVPADFCSNGIVTTSNITSNTVNLNWSGDASDWEYILQLKDGSVPTASDSGVVVNTTSDNAIGLNSFTDYEVYYRAICNSNAKSNWGLTSFKTEMQYDFVVAPGAPVTSTYVYDDSEDVIRFESTNGAPIHVRFNTGELTLDAAVGKINDYDKLIVKNGSGVNLDVEHWVDNAAGNVDISDLTFVSNDGVLEYYIQNNANSSTSNLNPINVTATVLSNGCTPPDVEFTKYFKLEDIASGNEQFFVKVKVNEASGTYDLSNNQGLSNESIAAGEEFITGPFEFNKDVILQVNESGNVDCFSQSGPFLNVSELKPINDEPEGAIILKDINDGGQPETTYHMEATPSSIPGSNISAANDDVWFKFNAEKNVYRVTIYDAINEGEIFHARYVLYKDLDSTSGIDLELVYSENGAALPSTRQYITPILEVGTDYYLRVYTRSNEVETGQMDVAISYGPELDLAIPDVENTFCNQQIDDLDRPYWETNNTIGLVNYSKPACFAYAGNPRFVLIETGKNLDPNGENIEFKVQVFLGIFEDLELDITSVSFLGSENPRLSINDIATYETGFISVENSGKFKVLSVATEVLNPGSANEDIKYTFTSKNNSHETKFSFYDVSDFILETSSFTYELKTNEKSVKYKRLGADLDLSAAAWKVEGELNDLRYLDSDEALACQKHEGDRMSPRYLSISNAKPDEKYLILVATSWINSQATIRVTQVDGTKTASSADFEINSGGASFIEVCDQDSYEITTTSQLVETLIWTGPDGNEITDARNNSSYTVTEGGVYKIQATGFCGDIIEDEINVFFKPEAYQVFPEKACASSSVFDLDALKADIRGPIQQDKFFLYPVTYYLSQDAAINEVDPLTPNTDGLYELESGTEVFVRVDNSVTTGACFNVETSFILETKAGPTINIDSSLTSYCEDNDSDDIVNAIVDLNSIVSAADTSFKFYDINDVEIATTSSYLAADQAVIKVLATSDIDGCESKASFTISISSRIVPVFDAVAPLCETETITLPTTSNNGITGEWVLLNSTTTSKEYIFTPDSSFCAKEVNMVVDITVLETPTFTQFDPVCETDTVNLPTTSLNSITGEWALISEDADSKNYEFTPDVGQCANTAQMIIQKIALEMPNFSQFDPICETQSVSLPSTSINGITGTWTLISEDASSASYEFTPDVNQCADVTTMVVQINELMIPYFEQIEPICSGSEVQLPNVSEGGANISGEWSLIDESINYLVYEFTPNSNQCASDVEMTIEIIGCEVPEGFSPNGDAYNQFFDLSSFGVKRLEVYNRYGKLVYSRNNYKKEWFGQDSGNGALPTGTYFYIITFNDNSKPKTGSVYINR